MTATLILHFKKNKFHKSHYTIPTLLLKNKDALKVLFSLGLKTIEALLQSSLKSTLGETIDMASQDLVNKFPQINHAIACLKFVPITSQLFRSPVEQNIQHSLQVRCHNNNNILASFLCYTMGSNNTGQLGVNQGNGKIEQRHSPVLVETLIYNKIKHVSCGSYHTIANSNRGEVFSWGANDFG